MKLSDLAVLLSGGDTALSGLSARPEEAARLAELKFPGKAYCLVEDWVLIDVTPTASQQAALTEKGLIPTFVYARSVVLDSRGRFFEGDWVRSTFEVYFEEPCWFLTKNTLYVLLGKGGRASGDMTTYGAFA